MGIRQIGRNEFKWIDDNPCKPETATVSGTVNTQKTAMTMEDYDAINAQQVYEENMNYMKKVQAHMDAEQREIDATRKKAAEEDFINLRGNSPKPKQHIGGLPNGNMPVADIPAPKQYVSVSVENYRELQEDAKAYREMKEPLTDETDDGLLLIKVDEYCAFLTERDMEELDNSHYFDSEEQREDKYNELYDQYYDALFQFRVVKEIKLKTKENVQEPTVQSAPVQDIPKPRGYADVFYEPSRYWTSTDPFGK